eukprot:GHVU01061353.1.p1 GENE.GHVU01061353.1~~GHVU01061353.1.p1  ORF type:complete len:701 (+),score=84.20 GHVU01061353.1:1490-3592(+)
MSLSFCVVQVFRGEERRRMREQLGADALDCEALFEFDEDGAGTVLRSLEVPSTELELRAALGILRRLSAQEGSYVHVLHRQNSIDYMFWCSRWQRTQLARYGQLGFIDDSHGKTANQYHLATFALINNHGRMVPAAFCFFSSTCHTWWKAFMQDCQAAARVTPESDPRPWLLGIADQHASIHGAASDVGVTMFECYHHFIENIQKAHSAAIAFTTPVHHLLGKYLSCACEASLSILETQIEEALSSFPPQHESAKDKEQAFFVASKSKRLLPYVSSFTYGHTSQSVAEAVFAWGQKLSIGPAVSVPLAVKRLIDLSSRLEDDDSRQTEMQQQRAGTQFGELAKVEKLLAAKGFNLFFAQYTQVIEYAAEEVENNLFEVYRRVGGRRNNVYKVNVAGNGECACNMNVWMEIPCRHLLAVRVLLDNGFFANMFCWSVRWKLVPPQVTFSDKSPTVASYDAALIEAGGTLHSEGGEGERSTVEPRSNAIVPLVIGTAPDETRPANPAELQSDIRQRFDGMLGAIGHSMPALVAADKVVSDFVASTRPVGRLQPGLQPCGKRIGRPRTLRMKAPAVQKRSNQKRSKGKCSCTVCKERGHDRRSCPIILAWKRDKEKKRRASRNGNNSDNINAICGDDDAAAIIEEDNDSASEDGGQDETNVMQGEDSSENECSEQDYESRDDSDDDRDMMSGSGRSQRSVWVVV